jgi:ribosomal protein S18 acetylase RimI-like enzyme
MRRGPGAHRLRTCFNGVTPPEVVLGFHQAFAALDEAVPDMTVLDNSTGTADDVADWIVGLGQASAPDAPPGRESGCAATVRPLFPADLDDAVLAAFDRYQETAQVWYYVGQAAPPFDSSDAGADRGYWEIRADRFVDDWDAAAKRRVIAALRGCLAEGGAVVGALAADGRLLGFASLRNAPLGRQGDDLELDYLHVSRECRGHGLGRRLFAACCCAARARGAARLYLGAHPSVETQRFYRALGCVPAAEIVAAVYAREPRDIQLEFVL